MIIAQIIEDIAPELASIDPDRRDRVIALAENQVGKKVFGDLYDLAVAYLAAHMLSIADRQGRSGQVTGLREGDLQIQFGSVSGSGGLNSTSYGEEFLRIRSFVVVAARTRMVGRV